MSEQTQNAIYAAALVLAPVVLFFAAAVAFSYGVESGWIDEPTGMPTYEYCGADCGA